MRRLVVLLLVLATMPAGALGAPSEYVGHPLARPSLDAGGPVVPGDAGPRPMIVGGAPAPVSAYPWAARLSLSSRGASYGECTGSLIGDRWVLTAAHCVTDIGSSNPTAPIPGLAVTVAVGGDSVDAATVYVHQAWDPATLRNDVALLALSRAVAARAVPLARADQASSAAPGTLAVTAGWGVVDPDATAGPGTLHAVSLPILTDLACAGAYPSRDGEPTYDPPTMLCAGPAGGGSGTCFGDSGGPLTVPDGYGGSLLVGSTSWGGVPCGSAGNPSVFARLPAYTAGIVAVTSGVAAAPAGPAIGQTGPAMDVTASSATLTGSVDPQGLATEYRIEFGPTAAYGAVAAEGYVGAGRGPLPVSAPVGGLAPGATYHFRVVADSAAGVSAGADGVLTTAGAAASAPAPAPAPAAARPPTASFRAKAKPAPCWRHKGARRTACLKRQRHLAALRSCAKKRTPTARARCRAKVVHKR